MICSKCDNLIRKFKLRCPKCDATLISPATVGLWMLTVLVFAWIVNSWLQEIR